MTRPTPTVLATPGRLNSYRYAISRELIDQAVLDLGKQAPTDSISQDATIELHAYLARAALDRLAEEAIFYDPNQPGRWAQLAHLIGVTRRQAQQLINNHLDPPDQQLWPDEDN